ncbi:MAG TPA: hypothetical protein VI386_10915 [Candidatus Sulfotelmatobacter sp.]
MLRKNNVLHELLGNGGSSANAPAFQIVVSQGNGRNLYVGVRLSSVTSVGIPNAERGLGKDLEEAMQAALEVDPPFIELNVSCPNLKAKDMRQTMDAFAAELLNPPH